MLALVVVLVVMGVWGLHAATRPLDRSDAATASPTCSPAETTHRSYVRSSQVTVSVYNAGSRQGFAALTLQRFESRGFRPGAVGNAPARFKTRTALVLAPRRNDPAATLVARTLGKSVPVKVADTTGLGPGINVIVGSRMRHLAHAPRRLRLPKPVTTCVSVD
jgi:hypothetical protein